MSIAPVYSVKTALRESFDETHGGSLAFVMRGRNLNRSERGLPGVGRMWWSPPVYSVKTALRESFYETHGGSLACIGRGFNGSNLLSSLLECDKL